MSGLLIDILLPDGEMKKYSKFIVQIVIAMIILSPIISALVNFKGGDFNYKDFTIDESYIFAQEQQEKSVVEDGLREYLKMNGIECTVKVIYQGSDIVKAEIYGVEFSKKTLAKELASKLLQIEKEKVITYE